MLRLFFLILVISWCCECVFVSSSFWAPLFNLKILNYRVEVPFNPDAGKNAREDFSNKFGDKGKKIIANLGNGKGPNEGKQENENYEHIKFYYTYSDASDKNDNNYN